MMDRRAVPKTQIVYHTTDLGVGRWEYMYDVYNISLTETIEEFTIWFGIGSAITDAISGKYTVFFSNWHFCSANS